MKNNSRLTTIQRSAFALLALTVGMTVAHASIIEPTALLPPPAGIYPLPLVCITPVCLANVSIFGFQIVSDVLAGGNELVATNAVFAAAVYQNNGGSPGAFVGVVSIPGTVDFTYFGRSIAVPLGLFNAQITDFDFAGTFNTHPFEVRQNPLLPSVGQTSITALGQGGLSPYLVDSFFDVFAELSLNNGPFVPGPVRHSDLIATPEPGSIGLAVFGLLGFAGWASRRRLRIR